MTQNQDSENSEAGDSNAGGSNAGDSADMFSAENAEAFRGLIDQLTSLPEVPHQPGAVERIEMLTMLCNMCSALISETTELFRRMRAAEREREGVPEDKQLNGFANEVALARREPPSRAKEHVECAKALANDLPNTFDLLKTGEITEEQALIIDQQTRDLSPEDRCTVDELVEELVDTTGPKVLQARVRELAEDLSPDSAEDLYEKAVAERRVTVRMAPGHGMAYLTALVPMSQAQACQASLSARADSLRATGRLKDRTVPQAMADNLVELITGQEEARAVPLEIGLLMTDEAMLKDLVARVNSDNVPNVGAENDVSAGETTASDKPEVGGRKFGKYAADGKHHAADGDQHGSGEKSSSGRNGERAGGRRGDAAAWLPGLGPVPAGVARQMIADTVRFDPSVPDEVQDMAHTFIHRLYTDPDTGKLVAMDSRSRVFPSKLRKMVKFRDDVCRTPWCDAPIRHIDHAMPVNDGGETTWANASGLCESCNYAKEAQRWKHTSHADGLTVTTPTGHRYTSTDTPVSRNARTGEDQQKKKRGKWQRSAPGDAKADDHSSGRGDPGSAGGGDSQ